MPELSFMVVLVDTAFSRFWMCDTPNHWDFAWPTLLFLNRFWHMTPFSESSWWAVLFESSFIKIGQETNKLDFFAIYVSKIHKSQNSQKLVGDRAKNFAPWLFSNFFPYKFICQKSVQKIYALATRPTLQGTPTINYLFQSSLISTAKRGAWMTPSTTATATGRLCRIPNCWNKHWATSKIPWRHTDIPNTEI